MRDCPMPDKLRVCPFFLLADPLHNLSLGFWGASHVSIGILLCLFRLLFAFLVECPPDDSSPKCAPNIKHIWATDQLLNLLNDYNTKSNLGSYMQNKQMLSHSSAEIRQKNLLNSKDSSPRNSVIIFHSENNVSQPSLRGKGKKEAHIYQGIGCFHISWV